MTHSGGKPHAVGDNGQRYEVRATGWPLAGESVIAWTNDKASADARAASILKAPSCTASRVIDRHDERLRDIAAEIAQCSFYACPECGADLSIATHGFGCSWPARNPLKE